MPGNRAIPSIVNNESSFIIHKGHLHQWVIVGMHVIWFLSCNVTYEDILGKGLGSHYPFQGTHPMTWRPLPSPHLVKIPTLPYSTMLETQVFNTRSVQPIKIQTTKECKCPRHLVIDHKILKATCHCSYIIELLSNILIN